jgi:hypothetical protein
MAITFLQLADKVLAENKKPLSVEEIWQQAVERKYIELLNSSGKTPMATLGAQLYVALRDGESSPFAAIGSRPKRFYLRRMQAELNLTTIEEKQKSEPAKKAAFLEKDLHQFVAYYANFYLRAYCKTINHSKSDKSRFGEWIHPDMVGCYFPIEEWESSALELSHALGAMNVKLFSFELKRELSFSNLREAFFQAVSNSSWANEGYLCAADISADEEFQSELKRLSGSFGIGVLRIDIKEPDSSEIIFPARSKDFLDWESINKLCLNPDFRDFIQRVKTDLTSREIRKERYDRVASLEELKMALSKSGT